MQSEDQLQAICYQWLHNTYPQFRGFFFAVPNGGFRDIREAQKLKATGTVPGIPDCILVWPVLIGFEFKKENGVLSEAQRKIHTLWASKMIVVHIIKDFSNFKLVIESLF